MCSGLFSLLPSVTWVINEHLPKALCNSLGPFYGAIAVPSVTRCRCCCRCRGHRCAGVVQQWRRATVATPGEWQCKTARSRQWAQHFSNAFCLGIIVSTTDHGVFLVPCSVFCIYLSLLNTNLVPLLMLCIYIIIAFG